MELPKQLGAVLYVHIQLHVTRLVDEVDAPIGTAKAARPQFSDAPSPHRVGPTREVSLLKRQDFRVAIRISKPQIYVQRQRVVRIKGNQTGIVKVAFDILCVGRIK